MIQTKEEMFLAEMGIHTQTIIEGDYTAKYKLKDLLKKYAEQCNIANVRARFITQEVILFQLKDGKYQDAAGNEITTEMLMEYSHDIDGEEGILWL